MTRLLLTVGIACLTIAGSAQTSDVADEIVTIPDDYAGRVVVWKVGAKKYAAIQPYTASVAQGSTPGKLAIGLVHSGYSVEDPDGKSAILTVSVSLENKPGTGTEQEELKSKEITPSDNIRIDNPLYSQVDISLKIDPAEEQRLRMVLSLPRKIEASATQPLSVRWDKVPGPTLYRWLTDPNGLKIVFKGEDTTVKEIPVIWEVRRKFVIGSDQLKAWWNKHVKDQDGYTWTGGVQPFAQNLIDEGTVLLGGKPIVLESAEPIFQALSENLAKIAKPGPGDALTVQRADFLTLAGEIRVSSFTVKGSADAFPRLGLGKVLLDHPEYVKDLSGAGQGLEPFKKSTGP